MDIKLIPIGSGRKFTFPALPEQIKGSYSAKYQSFDIISKGTIKIPKGTDVTEFSWDGEFFGPSKKNERKKKRMDGTKGVRKASYGIYGKGNRA